MEEGKCSTISYQVGLTQYHVQSGSASIILTQSVSGSRTFEDNFFQVLKAKILSRRLSLEQSIFTKFCTISYFAKMKMVKKIYCKDVFFLIFFVFLPLDPGSRFGIQIHKSLNPDSQRCLVLFLLGCAVRFRLKRNYAKM
jgi:hypothetical protein